VLAARVSDGQIELEHPQAAEFQQRTRTFLEEYGWRSDVFGEFGHRSWREDPSTPLTQLKGFIRKPDSEDPFIAHARQAAERDQAVEALASKVPSDVQGQFRGMLAMAQQYIPIAEDHNFTIDQKFTVVVREGMLRLGERLVAEGALNSADDVFYITLDEIRALGEGGSTDGLRERATERRRDLVRQTSIKPPPMLGTPPPADMPPSPLITKFFGFGVAPSDDAKVVVGYPASAGEVTGEAKVVMTLDEAGKVGPGDILVCRMTMPAWTPLFGVVAAVVADAGGPLSHCAIVAREYGIPCVAGTQIGTSVIRDGMRIRVDGSTGHVQILD
jgi:pyruvate,water dikinase